MALFNSSFGFESDLLAVDLNTLDADFDANIIALGLLDAELFGDWGVIPTARVDVDKIFAYDASGDVFYNFTNPSRHQDITPDWPEGGAHFSWASGDRIYFGKDRPFENLAFDFQTAAGASVSPTWQYFNTSTGAWTTLVVVDGTLDFTVSDSVTWTAPANWGTQSLNSALLVEDVESIARYWIRVTVGNSQSFKIDSITSAAPTGTNNLSLQVTETTPNSLSVNVRKGAAVIDGKLALLPSDVSIGLNTPPTAPKEWYAAVQFTKDGDIVVDYGDEANNGAGVQKNARVDAIKLADVEIDNGVSTIPNAKITDQRTFV